MRLLYMGKKNNLMAVYFISKMWGPKKGSGTFSSAKRKFRQIPYDSLGTLRIKVSEKRILGNQVVRVKKK